MAAAPCGSVDIAPVVQIPVGKSTVIKPPDAGDAHPARQPRARPRGTPLEDKKQEREGGEESDVSDKQRPGVADVDVLLLGPSEVYLLGKTVGSTNVVMLDRTGRCTAFDVMVGMDTSAVQAVLAQLLPDEKGIKVSAAFDSIVLSGTVSDTGALAKVTELANAYVRGTGGGGGNGNGANPRVVNMLTLGSPQQVMLEVKVAEVSKVLLDRLGTSLSASKSSGGFTYALLASFLTGSGGLAGVARNSGSFEFLLDAEKRDGLIKILAEPNVMAISGQEGSFLAGGKVFIPVSQNNQNGNVTITLEEKEFGVALKFIPTVLDGGRINLRVSPEVSELNREGVGISISGTTTRPSCPRSRRGAPRRLCS